jgi:hypothetical protein
VKYILCKIKVAAEILLEVRHFIVHITYKTTSRLKGGTIRHQFQLSRLRWVGEYFWNSAKRETRSFALDCVNKIQWNYERTPWKRSCVRSIPILQFGMNESCFYPKLLRLSNNCRSLVYPEYSKITLWHIRRRHSESARNEISPVIPGIRIVYTNTSHENYSTHTATTHSQLHSSRHGSVVDKPV